MVDIHTHILPRMDDGAKDVETSVAMLNRAEEDGVRTLVLTPHYYGKRSPSSFLEKRAEAFARLREAYGGGIELRLGAEVHFTGLNMPDFEELCSLAIEGTKYILIEFPFTSAWRKSLLESLSDFIYETGYVPIIAHAERYLEIRKRPAIVSELVQMGCLIQVNAQSFLDKRERGLALALLKHGFAHCFGSDAHDTENRVPNLAAVKTELQKLGYGEEWTRAQTIAEEVLRGGQVCVEPGKPIKKFFGNYL